MKRLASAAFRLHGSVGPKRRSKFRETTPGEKYRHWSLDKVKEVERWVLDKERINR